MPEKLQGEFFLPVKNTAERFLISNFGRVFSKPANKFIAHKKQHFTALTMLINGKLKIVNYNKAKLVLRYFKPYIQESIHVYYRDNDKTNAHIDNVVWTDEVDKRAKPSK